MSHLKFHGRHGICTQYVSKMGSCFAGRLSLRRLHNDYSCATSCLACECLVTDENGSSRIGDRFWLRAMNCDCRSLALAAYVKLTPAMPRLAT